MPPQNLPRLRASARIFAPSRETKNTVLQPPSCSTWCDSIHGRIEQVYHQGELVGEKRVPSERLLMWLLSRLDPKRFALPWERDKDSAADPQADAQAAFPALLQGLKDVAEG